MREIKFRLWHRENREMFITDLRWGSPEQHGAGWLRAVPFGQELATSYRYGTNAIQVDPHGCDIMQFTGLHDRDGKEIYEGDVYRYDSENPVTRDQLTAVVQWVTYPAEMLSRDLYAGFYFRTHPSRVEVIGNIYENPELLEPRKESAQDQVAQTFQKVLPKHGLSDCVTRQQSDEGHEAWTDMSDKGKGY